MALELKECWHFCMLQLGWFTIVVFLTSLFELSIFCIGFFGTDFASRNPTGTWSTLMAAFEFECLVGTEDTWFVDKTPASMTLFKLHFIVIFMYTTLFMIVLFKIPYKYDRLQKTSQEKKADRSKRAKRRQRRRRN